MDLLCGEGIEKHISNDPVLQKERVLHNLLMMEENYLPNRDYFTNVQCEIKPSMRCIVTNWMLDVSNFIKITSIYYRYHIRLQPVSIFLSN